MINNIELESIWNLKIRFTKLESKLRSVFLGRYGYANINEFFMLEKPYLEQLKQGLEELLKQGAFEDKIKANQIKWFISNLENFILKLNK